MAYAKTIWRDRAVERPRTYYFQNNPDGSVTLIPAPGTIYDPGTPVNAGNLAKLEEQAELSDLHINRLVSVHGATSILTASRIVQRDSGGRAEIATPLNSFDIANKGYVDGRTAQTRLFGGILEYWTGTEWRPVGGVKRVQRGTAAINNIPFDVIISAVDTSKTFINFPTILTLGNNSVLRIFGTLLNSTTLRLTSNQTSPVESVNWEVIESY